MISALRIFFLALFFVKKAEGRIRRHRKLRRALDEEALIPHEYVVVFSSRNAGSELNAYAEEIYAAYSVIDNDNAIVTEEFHSVFEGVGVSNLTSSALQVLLDNNSIEYIEEVSEN